MTELERILYERLNQVKNKVKYKPGISASDFTKRLNKAFADLGGCPGCKSSVVGTHAGNCPTQNTT